MLGMIVASIQPESRLRMLFRSALTVAVLLALTTPSWAQDPASVPAPAQTAPNAPAEPELSPEVQALQAEAQAFETAVTTMSAELATALEAAGDDEARARADSDAVIAKYQPDIDAFAAKVEAAATAEAAGLADETARSAKQAEAAQAGTMLRGLGPMIRDEVMQQMAAARATAAQTPAQAPVPAPAAVSAPAATPQ